MNDTNKVWMPAGKLTEVERVALSVPANEKPDPALYRSLLETKLQALVDADPVAARRSLEMSQDEAPELWAIAEQNPQSQWGSALARSEALSKMTQMIDWTMPGSLKAPEPLHLDELLELAA